MHRTPRLHSRDTTFLTSEIPTSGCVKLAQLPNVSASSAARPHTPLLPTPCSGVVRRSRTRGTN